MSESKSKQSKFGLRKCKHSFLNRISISNIILIKNNGNNNSVLISFKSKMFFWLKDI